MSACGDWMSANVGFILLNPGQDPIKLFRGYLASAECTTPLRFTVRGSKPFWGILVSDWS